MVQKYVAKRWVEGLTDNWAPLVKVCLLCWPGVITVGESVTGISASFCSCRQGLFPYKGAFSQGCFVYAVSCLSPSCTNAVFSGHVHGTHSLPEKQLSWRYTMGLAHVIATLLVLQHTAAHCFNSSLNINSIRDVHSGWFIHKEMMANATDNTLLFFNPRGICHVDFLQRGLPCAPVSEEPHCTYWKQRFHLTCHSECSHVSGAL